jgi:2-phosphoglycolate phosphatase
MPTPRAVLFDLDGTLADTFPLIVSSWNAAVWPISGRQYSTADVVSRFGVTDTAMLQRELPQHQWDQAVSTYYSHYEANHSIVKVFPGVPELLANLARRGLPLGLMTGKGRRSAIITLRCLGWLSLFGSIVTGDDVIKQKPAPDGLLLVTQQLAVAPQDCVWVGDSPADMKAGKAAGIYTVAAGWHLIYADRIAALQPDCIAQTPQELAAILLSQK